MTPKERFKVGFLLKCAESGMTMDETLEAVKTARTKIKRGMGLSELDRWNETATEYDATKAQKLKSLQMRDSSTKERVVLSKLAADPSLPLKLLSGVWGLGSSVGSKIVDKAVDWAPSIAIGGPIAVGTALGGTGGYLAAKATDISDDDSNDVKTQELIDEYRRMSEQARISKALQGFKATPRRGRPMY